MRPFMFRAWDKDKKIMIYDMCDSRTQEWAELYGLRIGDRLHPVIWRVGMIYETLMQFTGLKDKNGKEIYDSDIMTTDSGALAIIEWCEARLGYILIHLRSGEWFGNLSTFGEDNEVIGNIYENPELLEEKK